MQIDEEVTDSHISNRDLGHPAQYRFVPRINYNPRLLYHWFVRYFADSQDRSIVWQYLCAD
jgi:hypothetical protein